MGKCGNEYGPLTDIPDWSYAGTYFIVHILDPYERCLLKTDAFVTIYLQNIESFRRYLVLAVHCSVVYLENLASSWQTLQCLPVEIWNLEG